MNQVFQLCCLGLANHINITELPSRMWSEKRFLNLSTGWLVDRTPPACKSCSCSALRPKKKPRDNRDIRVHWLRAILHKGPGATLLPWMAGSRQDMATAFTTWWRRRLPFIGELMSGGLLSYHGNQQQGQGASTHTVTD